MKNAFYKIFGVFWVGIAALGVILPLLPTTPFLLIALACFARSSPALHQKLLNNKVFGPLIRDWQTHKAITRKSKTIAFISLGISAVISCWLLSSLYLQLVVLSVMSIPTIILYRLPVLPKSYK